MNTLPSAIPYLAGIFLFLFSSCTTPSPGTLGEWYPFTPTNTVEPGAIGMKSWLDAPAGKHGFLTMDQENLAFENGQPVRFWGTNICSRLPFVEPERADSFVNFIAKNGINAVRFHKFSWYAYDGLHSTRFDKEKFKNFDYFQSRLREEGIYYGWSHIYGHRVQPGDSARLLVYSEVRNLKFPWSHLNGSTASLVNFAPDLQDLSIALTVDMLNHVNPNTGLRYADDPALAFIEFQNEDNIFWAAIERSLEQAPTYRALLCRQFSDWLKVKYGSQKALEQAWGSENIPVGESLEKRNIYPQPNHGLFGWDYETSIKEKRPMATHLLDKARFLYDKQVDFYTRFEKAVRATGYRGVIVASCWQAGSGPSHFYNLHADYLVGMIDRHNYFGGGVGGHGLDTGAVRNVTMMSEPGSGLLSTGMQQVVDRPFAFSEWMSLVPTQWTAEAAPVIAFYGMGLQGWDASFSFATDIPRYSRYLQSEHHGVYNATSPLHMGLYPALARAIYRGDVEESPVMSTRNVHVPSLVKGVLGFDEVVQQGYDDKEITGTIPASSLAIGRVPVKFTGAHEETLIPDFSAYHDTLARLIRSVTGQLQWKYGERNYFTVNTPGTVGLVGFLPNEEVKLGKWTLQSANNFAVILITSLEKGKNLDEASEILVTTVARAKNTGMRYNEQGDFLHEKGDMPLLLEPVDVLVGLPANQKFTAEILDHDGLYTGKELKTKGNRLSIRGSEHKTLYYQIRRAE